MKSCFQTTAFKLWFTITLFACNTIHAQIVSTPAGNYIASSGYGGDGTNAFNLHILATGLLNDANGNLYFINGNAIRKLVIASGTVSTFAGSATAGFAGDGGNATAAQFNGPAAIAFDAARANLYIADQFNHRIRKIQLSNNIVTTVAGTGTSGFSGDGAAATNAKLNNPGGLAVDASGNVYISDRQNHRIRKITATGIISTIAGTGTAAFSGDGGVATAAAINSPAGIAIDGAGNIYFADRLNSRVRKIDAATGKISTIAGNGTTTYSGDGAAATAAGIRTPNNILLDASSPTAMYISDANNRIRKVAISSGVISTFAGTGVRGFSGDGASATNAMLSFASSGGFANSMSLDASGNLFFADGSSRIRRVNASNSNITTLAGTSSYFGDGAVASNAQLKAPGSVAFDKLGNMYIADYGNHRIRRVDKSTGIITTYAGNGTGAFAGDSSLAVNASLRNPACIIFDATDNLYIADQGNSAIRMVDAVSKKIYTVAGTGVAGFSGDNGDPKLAKLYFPSSIVFDETGNMFISDVANYRIRLINVSTNTIKTIAGNGTNGYSGDNGAASAAKISSVTGLAYFGGNLYIADQTNNVIRVIDQSFNIYPFAGAGTAGYSGDGGLATSAEFASPSGIAVDSLGNVYVADADNDVIRRINPTTGIITTFAGNSSTGYAGDGGTFLSATFSYPYALTFGNQKQLYVVDKNNSVIRLLSAPFALPVKLISFNAALTESNTVNLNWSTAQEINTSQFIIQRSINGFAFANVGTIRANGSNAGSSYNFKDAINGINADKVFYRLQMVDGNGQFEYSDVRTVVLKNRNNISVYPNPTNSLVNVAGANLKSITVYDMAGRIVKTYEKPTQQAINTSDWQNGLYLLSVITTDGAKSTQTILVKH